MKLALLVTLTIFSINAFAFEKFDAEAKRATSNIGCIEPKISGAGSTYGRLYSCIGGAAATVKFFINEEVSGNKVRNVKFMWNDYTKNTGYGVHSDSAIAKARVAAMATMYAPLQVEKVIKIFLAKNDLTIESEKYILKYTYSVGPAIDERLFVVTTK